MHHPSYDDLGFGCTVPRFAVLLAAYNGESWISDQLDSILGQSAVNVSIFISVDRSTDATLALCEQRARADNRISILPYGDRFGSAGRNFYRLVADVETSHFDFVAFSDQDDLWLPDKLSRAVEVLSSSKAKVYSSDVIAFWKDGRQEILKKSHCQRRYDHFFEAAGPGCTYVFTQQAYLVVKAFMLEHLDHCQTIALHDWLFYAICRESGLPWVIDDQPKMLYRQHESNQIGSNSNWRAHASRFKTVLCKSSWYRRQVVSLVDLFHKREEVHLSKSFLILHFREVRRRPRDQIALLIMTLLGIFV